MTETSPAIQEKYARSRPRSAFRAFFLVVFSVTLFLKVSLLGLQTDWAITRDVASLTLESWFDRHQTTLVGLALAVLESVATAVGIAAVLITSTVLHNTTITNVINNLDKIDQLEKEIAKREARAQQLKEQLRRDDELLQRLATAIQDAVNSVKSEKPPKDV